MHLRALVVATVRAQGDATGGSDDLGWTAVLAMGALFAVIGMVSFFVARESALRRWNQRLAHAREEARSVLDDLVPGVTDRTSIPAVAAEQWTAASARLDELETGLHMLGRYAPNTNRAAVTLRIGTAASALRTAVDSDVALRAQGADAAALAESLANVQRACDQLAAAL